MALLPFSCAHCHVIAWKEARDINRAAKAGLRVYCSRECSGLGRRKNKTLEQKRAEKAAYDAEFRRLNRDRLKAEKAAWYQRTADREKERVYRKANMARHVEYCRRPEYRAQKAAYDQRRRDQMNFGDFAEAAAVLRDLEAEITTRASRYEIYMERGTINKSLRRKREYEQSVSG